MRRQAHVPISSTFITGFLFALIGVMAFWRRDFTLAAMWWGLGGAFVMPDLRELSQQKKWLHLQIYVSIFQMFALTLAILAFAYSLYRVFIAM